METIKNSGVFQTIKKHKVCAILVLLVLLFAIGLLTGYCLAKGSSKQKTEAEPQEAAPAEVSAEQTPLIVVDIEGTVHNIGQLATAQYSYTITQHSKTEKEKVLGIKLPFSSSEVLYSYDGKIKAGIEFGEVQIIEAASGAQEEGAPKKIYVSLPDVIIISNELDNDSLTIYSEKHGILDDYSFSDVNESQAVCKQTALDRATENGLLDQAKENAENIITSTLHSLPSYETCEIIFN